MKYKIKCYLKPILFIVIWIFVHSKIIASDTTNFNTGINYTSETIKIDGNLDERTWQEAKSLNEFTNHWPVDTGYSKKQTEIKLAYNQTFIYIAAKCYTNKKAIVQTLKHDTDPWLNDGLYVILDPVNRKLFGYLFGVNAGGAQTEGIVQGDNLITEWNEKWFSAVVVKDSFYTVEMAIPFSNLRFNSSNKMWGINFVRSDMQNNCYSNWSPAPLQFYAYNLNYAGQLIWNQIPNVKHAENIILPYVNSSVSKDYTMASNPSYQLKAGIDSKISLKSSMNLDLTLNPDFSQIEVDQQVINLDRFNPLLPEKRTFFLENSDLFTNFGVGNLRPFVSRKIGLTDDGQVKPLIGGIRLSGNVNKDLRIGILDIEGGKFKNLNNQNYLVGVFEQKVLAKSTIKGIITNNNDVTVKENKYNRLLGVEFNYFSRNNIHQGAIKMHYTFNKLHNKDAQLFLLYYGYYKNKFNSVFYYTDLGNNFNPALGFSPYNLYFNLETNKYEHLGYRQIYNMSTQIYNSRNPHINTFTLSTTNYFNLFSNNKFMDARNRISVSINFKNTAYVSLNTNLYSTVVPFSSNYVGQKVNPGTYSSGVINITHQTDNRKNFSLSESVETGGYFGGKQYNFQASVRYRNPPFLNLSFGTNYNHIFLNQKNIDFILFNSSLELDFSKNLFWTSFLQYNTQAANFNINTKLQWRFRPMSDIYVVYTDNYQTDIFQPKNRMFSIKLNYWFNL